MTVALQIFWSNSERIFKIGQYLTKLCVEHLGFTFLAHSVRVLAYSIYNDVLYTLLILTRLNAFTRSCLFNASAVQ